MAGEFTDSPGKRAVRELWDTPLLRYLNEEHGFRFRYLGLPGPDCLDIRLWSDMVDEVIAFEVDARGTDPRSNILQLRTNLRLLNKPFSAFYGPFEYVVTQRRDWDNQEYRQKDLVTLYNLDFCDQIDSKIATGKNGVQILRFQALRQVLVDQAECHRVNGGPNSFVLMLTFRNQMDAGRLSSRLAENAGADIEKYRLRCSSVNPLPSSGPVAGTHAWAIKAFTLNFLRQYLVAPNVSSLFFPLVKYTGSSVRSPMLHWIVFCQFGDPTRVTPRCYPNSFLTDVPSLRVTKEGGVVVEREPGEIGNQERVAADLWLHLHREEFRLI